MKHKSTWGSTPHNLKNLENLENLENYVKTGTGSDAGKWRNVLRKKRWQIITLFGTCLLIVCFCIAFACFMFYMASLVVKINERYILMLVGLWMASVAYAYARSARRLYYLLVN